MTRARHITMRLIVLLALPARLIHELLHAITALPWAERVQVDILPQRGGAQSRVQWRESPPPGVVALSALAPLIAGLLALSWALWLFATGALVAPSTVTGWALVAIMAAYMAMIAKPSPQDVRQARGDRDE